MCVCQELYWTWNMQLKEEEPGKMKAVKGVWCQVSLTSMKWKTVKWHWVIIRHGLFWFSTILPAPSYQKRGIWIGKKTEGCSKLLLHQLKKSMQEMRQAMEQRRQRKAGERETWENIINRDWLWLKILCTKAATHTAQWNNQRSVVTGNQNMYALILVCNTCH